MSSETRCKHQPVYYGVININVDERTIGSVDVWHCPACKERFCEEKQLGIESISDDIGMPELGKGERWAVIVCKLQKGRDKWRLARLAESGHAGHECLGEKSVSLGVRDYAVDDDHHWSFLVDDHVNKAVEISGGGLGP